MQWLTRWKNNISESLASSHVLQRAGLLGRKSHTDTAVTIWRNSKFDELLLGVPQIIPRTITPRQAISVMQAPSVFGFPGYTDHGVAFVPSERF